MKTLLFIIISLFLGGYSFSQFGVPLATDDAIWTTRKATLDPETGTVVHTYGNACASGNDTLINTNNYTQITNCNNGDYIGSIREDNFKVYYVAPDSINEYVLYDFDVTVGQVLNNIIYYNGMDLYNIVNPELIDLEVMDIDTVNFDGLDRLSITVAPIGGVNGSSWIEGIGNTYGLLFESFVNIQNYGLQLLCYSEDNSMIYPTSGVDPCDVTLSINDLLSNDAKIEIYPNPSSGNVTIKIDSKYDISELIISNSVGQEVEKIETIGLEEFELTNLKTGIYFAHWTNGKTSFTQKFVVK